MTVNYSKPSKPAAVNYARPGRPRTVVTPDADGVIRLHRGESVVLR